MRIRDAIAGCVLLGMLGLVSCKGAREPVGETVTTGARLIMNDDAAMMLTNARCGRESVCSGAARTTGAAEGCRRGLFPEMQSAVRPEACPSGIDEKNLSHCIAELRQQVCDDERQPLESIPGCRHAELCPAP